VAWKKERGTDEPLSVIEAVCILGNPTKVKLLDVRKGGHLEIELSSKVASPI
jgi:hypothetical protein